MAKIKKKTNVKTIDKKGQLPVHWGDYDDKGQLVYVVNISKLLSMIENLTKRIDELEGK